MPAERPPRGGPLTGLMLVLLPLVILATCEGCVRTEIRPSAAGDIELMLPDMRQADIDEVEASHGHTIEEALRYGFEHSTHCWTGFVDDTPVCMWGATAVSLVTGIGTPWLLGTNAVERYQMTFLRRGRECVRQMSEVYPHLVNAVDARNTVSIRWLKWLGFHVYDEAIDQPLLMGPKAMPFWLFEMRRPADV